MPVGRYVGLLVLLDKDNVLLFLMGSRCPEEFVLKQISKKITQFFHPKLFGPDKSAVYLWVTYTGKAALNKKITYESLWKTVMDPWLYGLYLSPDKCCLQVRKMLVS